MRDLLSFPGNGSTITYNTSPPLKRTLLDATHPVHLSGDENSKYFSNKSSVWIDVVGTVGTYILLVTI